MIRGVVGSLVTVMKGVAMLQGGLEVTFIGAAVLCILKEKMTEQRRSVSVRHGKSKTKE